MIRVHRFFIAFLLIVSGFGSSVFAQEEVVEDSSLLDSAVIDTQTAEEAVLEVSAEDEEDEMDIRGFSLRSPYHSVLTHLLFLQPETYHPDTAAMALWGSPSPEKMDLAVKLKQYLDGSGYYIDVDAIPRDPKYVDSLSGKWKYVLVEEVPEIYLYRKHGNWYYSAKTLREIPILHKVLFPYGTLDWIPGWAKKKVLGLELWQFLGILIFLLGALIAYKLLTLLLSNVIEEVINRVLKKDIALTVVRELGRPLSLLAVTMLLETFTPILQFPPQLNSWVVLSLNILRPIFIVIAVYQLVDVLAAYFAEKAKETETVSDDQLIPLLRKVFKGLVVVVGVIFVLQSLKVNITALLAGISIGGLAIALAAQDTVKNFIGSILIFLDKPFQVGDWIQAEGVEGTVEEVGVRATRIRTFANSLVYVPNGTLADTNVNNMGLRVYRRFMMRVGLTYDTPPNKMEAFVYGVREMIKKHPTTRKDYYEVWFDEMGDSSLNILLYTFFEVPTWTQELKGKQDLLLGILRLAEALGVSFAFPTQTLHMENFPGKSTLTPTHEGTIGDQKGKVDQFLKSWEFREASHGVQGAFAGGEG